MMNLIFQKRHQIRNSAVNTKKELDEFGEKVCDCEDQVEAEEKNMRHVAAAQAKESKKCKSMLNRGDEGEQRCTMKEIHNSLFDLPRTDGLRPVQYPVRAQDWL
jgi:hypothetical protein